METDPANMRQAFKTAVNFEGLLKDPILGPKQVHIAAMAGKDGTDTNNLHVSPEEEEEDKEAEITAITKKL